jgi:cell wall-associated NlpC family hydrolase
MERCGWSVSAIVVAAPTPSLASIARFVGHVFREALGLVLPRTSREISEAGTPVPAVELEPGDLVFFNTMRQTFSHVGIYLGGNLFVHAPRPGQTVRVEDLRERYWARRYNGARRIER